MRVIAGKAKGRKLRAPRGGATRPTSDKVREGIFAMLDSLIEAGRGDEVDDNPWEALSVLDLYAGSGALGIEALSRGAHSVVFVEANPGACRTIKENLTTTQVGQNASVVSETAQQFLRRAQERFDLVIMDAPYSAPELEDVIELLSSKGLVREGGRLVVEHSNRRPLPDAVGALARVRERRYGDTRVSIYAR